jgi:flagellar biosynthesis protein FliQ
MTDTAIVDVLRHMFLVGIKVAGPVLLVALIIGIGVSIIQTVTQVQEPSIAFLLKLAAVAVVLIVTGPWMMHELRSFIVELWAKIGPRT